MTEAIIVAAVAVVGNIVVSLITHMRSQAVMDVRMKQLEEKVSIHNNLIDRMYSAEKHISLLQNDVDDLKKGQG